jgi:Asp-tRNA(Asn)/Glu-tRNA(Gln) amidotransferase A subunit family amidase
MIPAALGTQTQASIIRPASYCGAFGIKPTHGLLRVDGIAPLARSLDHLGVLGLHLADAWAVLAAMSAIGPEPEREAPELPVLLPSERKPRCLMRLEMEGWEETDPESKANFDRALDRLGEAGVIILDRRDPRVNGLEAQLADASNVAWSIFAWEAQWPLRAYLARGEHLVGDRLRALIDFADGMQPDDYRRSCERRVALRQEVAGLSAVADGFLSLSSSGPATRGLTETGSRLFPVPWTLVGGPSLSLPLLKSAGLPLGLQLMSFPGTDAATAAIGSWIAGRLGPPGRLGLT